VAEHREGVRTAVSAAEVILWVAFAVFWAMEAVCHYLLRNRPGSETMSHQTRRVAHRLTGPYAHLVLAVPAVLLLADLEGWL
jgi:hypothetical protein